MKQKGKHSSHKRQLPLFAVSMILLMITAVSFSAFIAAKYVSARKNDAVAEAQAFYFESDYLKEGGTSYTLREDIDAIVFELYNYADELRYSDVDIVSDVTLKKGTETIEQREITLEKGEIDKEEVTFGPLAAGTYTVTAVTSPYSKVLKATFEIRTAESGVSYSVSDSSGSPFLKVEVTSGHYDGKVDITWPAGVRPDNTDPHLQSATGSGCQVDMTAYSSYTFLFFKDNPIAFYDRESIQVTEVS